MAIVSLKKVEAIGEKYSHMFKARGGSFTISETTKEDYEQLATPRHKDPVMVRMKWVGSRCGRKFNTKSGDLELSTYIVDGDYATIRDVDGEYSIVETKKILNNGIDSKELIDKKIWL